jgi:hypothetical protein
MQIYHRNESTFLIAVLAVLAVVFLTCAHAKSDNEVFDEAIAAHKAEMPSLGVGKSGRVKPAERVQQPAMVFVARSDTPLLAPEIWLIAFAALLWFATERLVHNADKATQKQVRAYVLVEDVAVKNLDVGAMPEIVVTIKNSGQTPAKDVVAQHRLGFDDFPLRGAPLHIKANKDRISNSFLSSNGSLMCALKLPLEINPVEMDFFQQGKMAIYLVGNITYTNIFGQRCSSEYIYYLDKRDTNGTMTAYKEASRFT